MKYPLPRTLPDSVATSGTPRHVTTPAYGVPSGCDKHGMLTFSTGFW